MLNTNDILETIRMIHTDHLDIRTITMGISLLDCAADDADVLRRASMTKSPRALNGSFRSARKSKKNWASPSSISAYPSHLSPLQAARCAETGC